MPSSSAPTLSFAPSTRVRQRLLVLSNPTKYDVVFKVRTDSTSVVLDPPHGQIKAADTAVVIVYAEPGKTCPSNLGVLSIYARPVKSVYQINFAAWFNQELQRSSELAYKIPIERRNGFAALETICELPGSAVFVESVPFPTQGIDDADTKTAIGIDSDTITARHFNIRDIEDALPSESIISTCHNVMSDVQTCRNIVSEAKTARNINEKGWIAYFFDFLFPIGSAEDAGGPHRKMARNQGQDQVLPCGAAVFGRQ